MFKKTERFECAWWIPWICAAVLVVMGGRSLRPSPDAQPRDLFTMLKPAVDKAELPKNRADDAALLQLDQQFASRPDLQAAFGIGPDLNLTALLAWALNDEDSGTFRLTPYRTGLRNVADQLNR